MNEIEELRGICRAHLPTYQFLRALRLLDDLEAGLFEAERLASRWPRLEMVGQDTGDRRVVLA